jgi:amino acid transporter
LTAADPSSTPAPRAGGLTTAHLFMMSFGAIVGVGWITILGQWLSLAGPGGSVIALVLGAASVLLIASNYGLLSRTQRLVAGEIGAVTDSLGAIAGFAVTAALAMASISVVAFEAVSAGWIMVTLFPALEGSVLYSVLGRDVHAGTLVIALVGTTVVGIMNLRPLPKTARTQNAVVLLKLAVTAVFCIAGLTSGKAQNLLPLIGTSTPNGSVIGGILALTATMPLWYAGFHIIAIMSEERAASVRLSDVSRAMYASIVAACVFYICIVLAASAVVPWRSLISAPLPAAVAFREGLSSTTMANMVLLSGLLGICSAWIACFAAAVRILKALRGQLTLRVADEKTSARRATFAITAIAIVLSLSGRAALIPIVNVAAMCFGLVYLLVSVVAWKHAVGAMQRCKALLGACVAAFMAAYVMFSAVNDAGWKAPEVVITVLCVVVGAMAWKFRSRGMLHAH